MIRLFQTTWTLVRVPNLLMIAATQAAMRYLVMDPLLPSDHFTLRMGGVQFGLLMLATMLIAAGGYVINDYFDTRTDMINRPARVMVGREISRRNAMILHALLNITGVGIGLYLGFYIRLPLLSVIFILASGLLWFYSTHYKRQFLLGNLIVAFLAGLVPVLVALFEIPLLNRAYGEEMIRHQSNFNFILAWVGAFGFFAFLTTLIREIIKDAEDFEGDASYGMRTLPIVLGLAWTRVVIVLLTGIAIASLAYLLWKHILFSVTPLDYYSLGYFLLLLILPLLWLVYRVITARNKDHYRTASRGVKGIMLSGILYSVMVYLLTQSVYQA